VIEVLYDHWEMLAHEMDFRWD